MVSLPKRKKVYGGLIAFVFPAFMFLSVYWGAEVGVARSPEELTEQNGDKLIEALNKYYDYFGSYPNELAVLSPVNIETIPLILSAQGVPWLYESNVNSFTLGYIRYPDKLGSTVCVYQSSDETWECEFNEWGPFTPIPTGVFVPTQIP